MTRTTAYTVCANNQLFAHMYMQITPTLFIKNLKDTHLISGILVPTVLMSLSATKLTGSSTSINCTEISPFINYF